MEHRIIGVARAIRSARYPDASAIFAAGSIVRGAHRDRWFRRVCPAFPFDERPNQEERRGSSGVRRIHCVAFLLLFSSVTALAADLKIKDSRGTEVC